MPSDTKPSSTRHRIINAAIEVVSEHGGPTFSLEEVAKKAGISKGGLLYNFPTKAALIKGMIQQFVGELQAMMEKSEAQIADDPYPNKLARAMLVSLKDVILQESKPKLGIVAAIGEDGSVLDPIRQFNEELFARIEAESDNPNLARTVYFAVEGIRATRFFTLMPLSDQQTAEQLDRMIDALKNDTL
ncbi:TetR/AcrR family transcriptional regulator [Pseudovibrio flavus]|uniref:TetR/AcrR family transcriptional regulator n=1 Tax=Pseudovibrio flavus TaxID=2529854 RepID=UPI00211BBFEB|nr:TetR/AcrR family transcriptional regulator [Pseudovibrio flavus]